MNFSLFVSFADSYNFTREEIFNIRTVTTANNRRTFDIIYKIIYGKQNKLNVFGKIDCLSSEHDQK